ncbi:Hypothetical predicted protein [Marmota monax]|uniref:Uncharacterized protein n=1 Tax=Marmota monax TaxID=9995 RepID=A0A5E4B6P1_MARMO|nr:hypothetical protein GHT09_004220 [Marmota monax]VTJ65374.1 Hypothetical predicted protein [Marmota monax]
MNSPIDSSQSTSQEFEEEPQMPEMSRDTRIPWGTLLRKIQRKGPRKGHWPNRKPRSSSSQDLPTSIDSLLIYPWHFCTFLELVTSDE